jgi:hypothetical protein
MKIFTAFALLVLALAVGGCSTPFHQSDAFAYRVTSVTVLSGEQSHVSDSDTYLIVARGIHSEVHAEGYDPIRVGTDLCEMLPGLIAPKMDASKSCQGNVNFDYAFYKITSETAVRQ